MNKKILSELSLSALVISCATTVCAQSPPGAIPVGPMFLYPALEIAAKHDSNVTMQNGVAARSDNIGILRGSVRLEGVQGVNIYSLGYIGEMGRYNSQTRLNYENHALDANANMTFDIRNRLTAKIRYLDGVDPIGTLNVAATPTPNHYREPGVTALYTFGAQDAQGKLELTGSYLDRQYLNNRLVTTQLDHSQIDYGGTFLWRVFPKTYATFNLKQSKYDYTTPGTTLDSTNTFIMVGLRWEATAQTTGRFSIGQQKKRFDSAGVAGFSGTSWEGGVNWRPLTYSNVEFYTSRSTSDFSGVGDFAVSQLYRLSWNHAWSSRVSSSLTGLYANDQFSNAPVGGLPGTNREDTTKSFGLRGSYQMQRWLNLGAEYTYTTRDSNDSNFNYNRNLYMLFIRATL